MLRAPGPEEGVQVGHRSMDAANNYANQEVLVLPVRPLSSSDTDRVHVQGRVRPLGERGEKTVGRAMICGGVDAQHSCFGVEFHTPCLRCHQTERHR